MKKINDIEINIRTVLRLVLINLRTVSCGANIAYQNSKNIWRQKLTVLYLTYPVARARRNREIERKPGEKKTNCSHSECRYKLSRTHSVLKQLLLLRKVDTQCSKYL